MWVLGIELRLSGLATSTFTQWGSPPASRMNPYNLTTKRQIIPSKPKRQIWTVSVLKDNSQIAELDQNQTTLRSQPTPSGMAVTENWWPWSSMVECLPFMPKDKGSIPNTKTHMHTHTHIHTHRKEQNYRSKTRVVSAWLGEAKDEGETFTAGRNVKWCRRKLPGFPEELKIDWLYDLTIAFPGMCPQGLKMCSQKLGVAYLKLNPQPSGGWDK